MLDKSKREQADFASKEQIRGLFYTELQEAFGVQDAAGIPGEVKGGLPTLRIADGKPTLPEPPSDEERQQRFTDFVTDPRNQALAAMAGITGFTQIGAQAGLEKRRGSLRGEAFTRAVIGVGGLEIDEARTMISNVSLERAVQEDGSVKIVPVTKTGFTPSSSQHAYITLMQRFPEFAEDLLTSLQGRAAQGTPGAAPSSAAPTPALPAPEISVSPGAPGLLESVPTRLAEPAAAKPSQLFKPPRGKRTIPAAEKGLYVNPENLSPLSASHTGVPISEREAGGQGFIRVTAKAAEKVEAIRVAAVPLNTLQDLMEQVMPPAENAAARLTTGPLRGLQAILQTDSDKTLFRSLGQSIISAVARAGGEVGALTKTDQDLAKSLIPQIADRADVAFKKILTLRQLYVNKAQAILGKPFEKPVLTKWQAEAFFSAANGDKKKAESMAIAAGFTVQ
ncbi:MAG: hypothetical protein JRD68_00110 [Deltaproteobacteria bacterium]|nr:hypothetical protein [Deltaproteobacteria bacterium]